MSGPGLFGNKFFSRGTKVARKASIIALDNNNSIKEGFFECPNNKTLCSLSSPETLQFNEQPEEKM